MFIPLTGNYRIRELLSSPLVVALFLLSSMGLFLIFSDLLSPKHCLTVVMPDHKIKLLTRASTVREALKDAGIELEKDCLVIPGLSQSVSASSVIQVIRKNTSIVRITEKIPPLFPIVKKTDLLKKGNRVVLQEEIPGERHVFYQETYFNNSLVSRKMLEQITAREPVRRCLLIGTGRSNRLDRLRLFPGTGKGSLLVSSDMDSVPDDSLLFIPDYGYIRSSSTSGGSGSTLNTAPGSRMRAYYIH